MKSKPKYAAKGLPKVPGKPKGTDIIPAWLTPGEAVLSPGAAEMLGRENIQALNQSARVPQQPQYLMGGATRVGQQPRYLVTGGMVEDERRRYNDLPTPTAGPAPMPAGYGAGQQIRETLAGQNDRLGKFTAPIETGMNSMAEVYKQTGNVMAGGTQRLANTIDQGQNAVSNFARGAMGLQPSMPAAPVIRPTPAASALNPAATPPAAQPAMAAPAARANVPAAISPVQRDGSWFADAASADAASKARPYTIEPSPIYPGGTRMIAKEPTSPAELARMNAAKEQMDRQNAAVAPSAARPLTPPMPRPMQAQPVMQPYSATSLPKGWTQADMERNDQMNSMARAFVSPQAMRMADIDNASKYWSTVRSLESGLNNAASQGDAESARSYAAALGGFNGVNQGGTASAASMINTDRNANATNLNSSLDYNAKLQEIGAGQGLRDAEAQEAQARAQSLNADAALQRGMLENPERYGARGGGRTGRIPAMPGAAEGADLMYQRIPGATLDDPDMPVMIDKKTGRARPVTLDKSSSLTMPPIQLIARMRAAGIQPGSDQWNQLIAENNARLASQQ